MNIRRKAAVCTSAICIFIISSLAPAQAGTSEEAPIAQPISAKVGGTATTNDIGEVACRVFDNFFEKC